MYELGYLTRVFCLGDFLHSIAKKPELLATAVADLYSLIVDLILSIFIYSYLFLFHFYLFYLFYADFILRFELNYFISQAILYCNLQCGLSPVKGRFP